MNRPVEVGDRVAKDGVVRGVVRYMSGDRARAWVKDDDATFHEFKVAELERAEVQDDGDDL